MTTDTRGTIEHDIGVQGSLTIRGFDADIELRAVDGPVVRVQGDGSRPLDEDYRAELASGELRLTATGWSAVGFRWLIGRRCQPIRVEAPRGAQVRVENASGSIRADGLVGRQRYRSTTGDISLHAGQGVVDLETVSGLVRIMATGDLRADVRTVSGGLDLEAPTIAELRARTTSGSLRLSGSFSGTGPFGVETVSGDVRIDPLGPIRVEGTTVSGDVHSSLPHRSGGSPGRRTIELGQGGSVIGFRSISGDLEVGVPRSSGGDAAATAEHRPDANASTEAGPPADATQGAGPVVDVTPEGGPTAIRTPVSPPPGGDAPDTTEAHRLAILRELEAGTIDVSEAERRLSSIDERSVAASVGAPPTASSEGPAAELGWVRRV